MSFEGTSFKVVAPGLPRFHSRPAPLSEWSLTYRAIKSTTDIILAIVALPIILMVSVLLLFLNPFFNPGPLLFLQERMGLGGQRFRMWKFRSMLPAKHRVRGCGSAVETHRITTLGRLLRLSHFDELPNFINVLRGEMSVVGPRPEAWSHALSFIASVPNYRARFRVRPGITGIAQVECGYADDFETVCLKAKLDCQYVEFSNVALDLSIIGKTLRLVLSDASAK